MAKRITQSDNKTTAKIPQELITAEEFSRRKRIWRDIYAKARQSEAYKRCLQMQEAVRTGNKTVIHKLRAEATERIANGDSISKPAFEDPDLDMVYGRIGIKEYWDDKIKKTESESIAVKTT